MRLKDANVEVLANYAIHVISTAEKDPVIANALKEIDYDENGLREGTNLWMVLQGHIEAHNDARAKQKEKKISSNKLHRQSNVAYMKNVTIAATIFKSDPEIIAVMGLDFNRARDYESWYRQAVTFYNDVNNNSDVQLGLFRNGISRKSLDSDYTLLTEAHKARMDYKKSIGNSRALRVDLDKVREKMESWLRGFKTILHQALEDNPKHLVKMKIDVNL